MTPEFAERIDPVFLYVFRALRELEDRPASYAEYVQRELNEMLNGIRGEAGATFYRDRDWPNAIYAVTCWIDEMFSEEHRWSGSKWWEANPLEARLFSGFKANSRFYTEAKLANREDSLESYYDCAMLGFKGLYADLSNKANQELITELELPGTHSEWVEAIQQRLEAVKKPPKAQPKTEARHEISVATPLWRWKTALTPWLFAPVLLGIWLVILRLGK